MKIDDPALRAAAIGKFKHSLKLAADLKSEMDGWWASKPVRITQELREDERTLDIVATTDSLPPVEDWSNRINDVFQNLNSALNRLTFAIDKMVGGSAKPDGNYPVHTGDEGWSNWVGKHKDLPSDVLDRYRAFEPFVSGRPGLAFLRRATNAERALRNRGCSPE